MRAAAVAPAAASACSRGRELALVLTIWRPSVAWQGAAGRSHWRLNVTTCAAPAPLAPAR